ncbi:Hypothetical protein GbCGDNIH9_0361 [Granulibacter bethesdensis]|uniref:DUF403 domain-containing protein n=1 Tax=Granulibacter bethesdensis TaxID=364410 RepID=A0AAC9K8T4_9PROT|nr:alpha-E domain-containing protein [Granulibacter bethesdensis]APH53592.1 Hypothetical protein GbCGDNIH9_0361 [Granulibacter bethesdensis]APH61170.1 Hypothetical protein GbCGDNIH8_0361 [Granulibacter bethesdensis]
MPSRHVPLLARYAESLFWMARYLERVENLARLIDVIQNFESPGRETESWYSLICINGDEANFLESGLQSDADGIKRFYLLSPDNPTSMQASIEAARTNARALRPLISTEMWLQLNIFHRDVMAIRDSDLEGDHLSRLCTRLKEGVQAHTGITEGTFFRDEGWHFYQLGRQIERADQSTRLLDIKYNLLMPKNVEERRVKELTQWMAILRAAAGYHAFRRISPPSFLPGDIVAFLLNDTSFPRSVAVCVLQIEWHVTQLRRQYGLRGTAPALEQVETLRDCVMVPSIADILAGGLHDFLDGLQNGLSNLSFEIGQAFFRDWPPRLTEQPDLPAFQSQTQTQNSP